VHLLGLGDSASGIYVNPAMQAWLNPVLKLQFNFYLNAACADSARSVDASVFAALQQRLQELPPGMKAMLLAFDYWHNDDGQADRAASSFHVPNDYAAACAAALPDRIEWVASIHPYRDDAVTALRDCVARGAKAIKWLPPAMGIDPASPRCDAFYDELARLQLPLISHAGTEHAAPGKIIQEYGNPLLLRRALERGVRVIVAHCASLGRGADLDRNSKTEIAHFDLFARLMQNDTWRDRLYGDLSAVNLVNRERDVLPRLLQQRDWHARLLQASDYPLPAVMPIVSLRGLHAAGVLTEADANLLMQVRQYNALWFDFLLKRALQWQGHAFAPDVFHTRHVFELTKTTT
jgi:mannonate dehydratase